MTLSADRYIENNISKYTSFIEECFDGKEYTLEDVAGGHSYDIKVKAHCDDKDYIIKVINGNSYKEEKNQNRTAWYQALCQIHNINPCLLGPIWYGLVNNRVVTITEWIYGEQLNGVFDEKPELMIPFGRKVGKLLYKLHHQKFVKCTLRNYNVSITLKVMDVVSRLENEIKSFGIDFQGMDKAIAYLKENKDIISEDRAGIVHNDIRPENFILADEKIYIYDFDSGTVNDCYADFTYLSAISPPNYRAFSYAVIMSYFDSNIPMDFWKANLYYSIMKLLDYAVYKYHKSGKMIVNQANNFIGLFDNYETPVPAWWREQCQISPF